MLKLCCKCLEIRPYQQKLLLKTEGMIKDVDYSIKEILK